MPQRFKFFGGFGIVPAALLAIMLNLLIPKDKKQPFTDPDKRN